MRYGSGDTLPVFPVLQIPRTGFLNQDRQTSRRWLRRSDGFPLFSGERLRLRVSVFKSSSLSLQSYSHPTLPPSPAVASLSPSPVLRRICRSVAHTQTTILSTIKVVALWMALT